MRISLLAAWVGWTLSACATTPSPSPSPSPAVPSGTSFPPLGVGGDFASSAYRKLTAEPFLSRVHGNRWVDVYISQGSAAAYLDGGDIPVGTTVVKTSFEDAGGQPSSVIGPTYVMRKEAPGYAPEHEDWYYAIYWADPTPEQRAKLGGPVYWEGRSPRVAYCYDCHDSYDRCLGGLTPSSVLLR